MFSLVQHKKNFSIWVFLAVCLDKIIFIIVPRFFPFWWTLSFHLIPYSEKIFTLISPPLFEACVVTLSVILYCPRRKHLDTNIYLFIAICIFSIALTLIIGKEVDSKNEIFKIGFSQQSFSSKDYHYSDNYPNFSLQIEKTYLDSIDSLEQCDIIVLPESIFLEDGEKVFINLKKKALERRCYIFSGILLKKDDNLYNCAVLFPPNEDKEISVYKKRNLVPFVETKNMCSGDKISTMDFNVLKINPMICFDSIYPKSYCPNADINLSISNGVFAEGSCLGFIHRAYGTFYSRTMARPLLQITQNGSSFYIDSKGKVHTLADFYEKKIDVFQIEL